MLRNTIHLLAYLLNNRFMTKKKKVYILVNKSKYKKVVTTILIGYEKIIKKSLVIISLIQML